jgi:hypothetical protein
VFRLALAYCRASSEGRAGAWWASVFPRCYLYRGSSTLCSITLSYALESQADAGEEFGIE